MPGPASRTPVEGFTLVEVILAVMIATGILIVALYFYQQSATLRTHLIEESDRLAEIRLLMERITSDLRTLVPQGQVMISGDATSLQLLKASVPVLSPGFNRVQSDLLRVRYSVTRKREGTNEVVSGIVRSQEPFVEWTARAGAAPADSASTNSSPATVSPGPAPEPSTTTIRHLRFAYWDGRAWVDEWLAHDPPAGISVSLGTDPLPEDLDEADYPGELFRRVVFVPSHGAGSEWDAGLDREGAMDEGRTGVRPEGLSEP